jgi:hypothetical protein
MSCYLFAHFIGESYEHGEQIYFSVSEDGLHWQDLNGGKPVLRSHISRGGVRDPFLIQHPITGSYYLIATDERIQAGYGWEHAQYQGSHDLILWRSGDLIHWDGPVARTVGVEEAGCVWAPEAVFDPSRGEFLVFWASMTRLNGEPRSKQRIYASWTGDFDRFSRPFVWMERDCDVIDTTVVRSDGWYYRFSKDEVSKRLMLERGRTLTGPFQEISSSLLQGLRGVEGPACFRLPDGQWCLLVDQYAVGGGYRPFLIRDLANGNLQALAPEEYDLGERVKRHGSVLEVSENTLAAVCERWDGK